MYSQYIFVILLVYFVMSSSCESVEKQWKDYKYVEDTQSFYKMYLTRKSWIDAKAICESEEALLFYPDDVEEAQMMKQWWGEVTMDRMSPRSFPFIHIGISDMDDEGQYETVDGFPISEVYHQWSPGEPNMRNEEEHCGQLQYDLTINDVKCNGTENEPGNVWFYLPFVCKKREIKYIQIETTTEVEEVDLNEYTYIEETESFYKIHNTRKSWLDAKAICESEGALLFYAKDKQEAKMMRKWWGDVTFDRTVPWSFPFIHLGISDLKIEGQYETVDGIPISEVYHVWSPGEPNSVNKEEHCGQLQYDLTINDVKCNGTATEWNNKWFYLPFVCKKENSSSADIHTSSTTESTVKQYKDYVYKEETDSFYKAYNTRKSWVEARAICETEGALLFYPDNVSEAVMIRRWWEATTLDDVSPRGDIFIHIGITDMKNEGVYKTVDGIPMNEVYDRWAPGEPNNAKYIVGDEDCANLQYNLQINDAHCSCDLVDEDIARCRNRFICKRRATSTANNPSGTKANIWRGYTFINETNSLYKIHTRPTSWLEAVAVCETEKALLFYPENKEEAEIIKDFWGMTTSEDMSPRRFPFTHIGLSDAKVEGQFETVDGIPIDEVYHEWDTYMPRHPNRCAHLFYDLSIHREPCDAIADDRWGYMPFICKKKLTRITNNSSAVSTDTTNNACHIYCITGNCTLTEDGLPKCSCPKGFSGHRCTSPSACHNYCLNDRPCALDDNENPVCQCDKNHEGLRCEILKTIPNEHLGEKCSAVSACHNYCLNNGTCSTPADKDPVCKCNVDYEGPRCETLKKVSKDLPVCQEATTCGKHVIAIVILVLILAFIIFSWLAIYFNWFVSCRHNFKSDFLSMKYVRQ